MRQISLRGRLVLGLVGAVAVGLIVANVLTYVLVRNFLYERVDSQLEASLAPSLALLRPEMNPDGGRPSRGGGGGVARAILPPGTFAQVRSPDGSASSVVVEVDSDDYPEPNFPAEIPGTFFDVGSQVADLGYRVVARPLPDGSTLLVAIPLDAVEQTLGNLRLVGFIVSLSVIALVAAMSLLLVRFGLRPLDRIASTAGQIASGHLDRRVEPAEPDTEIGRLGLALNQMLASLETAFAHEKESQERLRRFVADASHELRTPLTSIRGYAELFDRGASERPEDLARVMRRIGEESDRMSVLVEDLLLLARLDQNRPLEQAPVDLAQLARDAVDDARIFHPDRPLTLSAPQSLVVSGDDHRLRQVVHNLVTNALKHTPPEAPVDVAVWESNGTVHFRVTDEGPGLSSEDAARVFEPFFRVDKGRTRDQGGTGLGLAIVKAIVEAHAGHVAVRPHQPRGTEFEVLLPLSKLGS